MLIPVDMSNADTIRVQRLVLVLVLLASGLLVPSAVCAQPHIPRPDEQRFWVGAYTEMAMTGDGAGTALKRVLDKKGADYWYVDLGWQALESRPGEYNRKYIEEIHKFLDVADANGVPVLVALHKNFLPEWGPWEKYYTDEIQQRFKDAWKTLAGEVKRHPSICAYMIMCEVRHSFIEATDAADWADKYYAFENAVAGAIKAVDPDHPVVTSSLLLCQGGHAFDKAYRLAQFLRREDNRIDFLDDHCYVSGWWWEGAKGHEGRAKHNPHTWQNLNPMTEPVFYNITSDLHSYCATAMGCPWMVNEAGLAVPRGSTAFGDDERLLAFERMMAILYDMGVSTMVVYGWAWGFSDGATYFPKLVEFRDTLIAAPRPAAYDVLVATDHSVPQIYDLQLSDRINPTFRVLDESGYSWFLTGSSLVEHLQGKAKKVFPLPSLKNTTEDLAAAREKVRTQLEGIEPTGRRLPYPGNTDFRYSMTGLTCSIPVEFAPREGIYDAVELRNGKVRLYAPPGTEVTLGPRDGKPAKQVIVNGRHVEVTSANDGEVKFKLAPEAALGSATQRTWDVEINR